MGRRAMLAIAATATLAAACNHDTLPAIYPDGGPDFTRPEPDLALGVCRTHQILSVPLDDIQPVSPMAGRIGSTLLVYVAFSLREGCDVPGDINVRVMPGNATDFVVITMRAWRGSNDCGAPKTAYRIIALGPDLGIGNPNLLISDGAPGGTTMLRLQLANPPVADCMLPKSRSADCDADCQCVLADKAARCVRLREHVRYTCQQPCSEDPDCARDGWYCDPGDPGDNAVCAECRPGNPCGCPNDETCGFGQVCSAAMNGTCFPLQSLPPAKCSCDGDCGEGRLCAQDGTCVIPCTTSAGCPVAAPTCDGGRCR